MYPSRLRTPPLVFALCLALGLIPPPARAGANSFCGGAATPTVPSDLANGVGDQSLEYSAGQPASMLTCARGYMFEKCGDHETANRVFDKCIAAGYAGAMIWKARLLEEGAGVAQDLVRATELLHRAAVSGDPAYGPIGKMHYATALQLGRGIDKNEAEARKWFEAAAAEGSPEAREFLLTGYHTGARGYDTLGAGTPTAAALAGRLSDDSDEQPAAPAGPPARPVHAAVLHQARKLLNDAAAATLPPATAQPPAGAEIRGQKLARQAPPLAAAAPPAPILGLGLLLLAAFAAGIVRRQRGAAPITSTDCTI